MSGLRRADVAPGLRPKVLFVLPAEGQPRYRRRQLSAEQHGFTSTTVGFVRDRFTPEATTIHPQVVLGAFRDRRYASRLRVLALAVRRLRRALLNADIVHCFGFDMAVMVLLAGLGRRQSLIVEISDIHALQTRKSIIWHLVGLVEGIVLRRASALVVTSEAFLHGYLGSERRHSWDRHAIAVVHNVPEVGTKSIGVRPTRTTSTEMTIGYFGVITCEITLRALLEWTQASPERRLRIAGTVTVSSLLREALEAEPGVTLSGPYRNPDDLPVLYDSVDLVWSAFPITWATPANWQWARTNRFFECCAFSTPPIVRAGTPDAESVSRLGLGVLVDVQEGNPVDSIVEQLSRLGRQDIEACTNSIDRNRQQLLENSDFGELLASLGRQVSA